MKVAVLGTGRVGSLIALDLATKHEVTAFDSSTVNLQRLERTNSSIRTVMCELRNTKRYPEMLEGFDLVVSAVPGWFGYYTLKAIIEAGKNVVDISFSAEDPFHLNELALEKNVTAVVDCGVAPGLSHMIAGMDDTQFKLEKFTCYVGGLPKIRTKPFEYKAPFSPMDVIEEYTRPARLMEDGRVSTRAAFSDLEHIQAGKIGTLEAFNTDGLRTLLRTMKHVPNMVEKTLRYPGHANLMTTLFDTGLLEGNLDVLFDKWHLGPDDEDFTYMKVITEGSKSGSYTSYTYVIYDEYDPKTGFHSMSRTTGYTCTAVANLLLDGLFNTPGIIAPEQIGAASKCFGYVVNYLYSKGIKISATHEE